MERVKGDLRGFNLLVFGVGVRGSGVVVRNLFARYVVLTRVRVRMARILINKEKRVRGEDVCNQGRGIGLKKDDEHYKQDADSRHAANQTLLANGQVGGGKRGPVKKWKKLDG
jgi:hypothetical protein